MDLHLSVLFYYKSLKTAAVKTGVLLRTDSQTSDGLTCMNKQHDNADCKYGQDCKSAIYNEQSAGFYMSVLLQLNSKQLPLQLIQLCPNTAVHNSVTHFDDHAAYQILVHLIDAFNRVVFGSSQ